MTYSKNLAFDCNECGRIGGKNDQFVVLCCVIFVCLRILYAAAMTKYKKKTSDIIFDSFTEIPSSFLQPHSVFVYVPIRTQSIHVRSACGSCVSGKNSMRQILIVAVLNSKGVQINLNASLPI